MMGGDKLLVSRSSDALDGDNEEDDDDDDDDDVGRDDLGRKSDDSCVLRKSDEPGKPETSGVRRLDSEAATRNSSCRSAYESRLRATAGTRLHVL